MLRTICSLILFTASLCIAATAQTEAKFLVVKFPEQRKTIFIRGEDNLSTIKSNSSNSSLVIRREPPRTLSVKGKGEIQYREHKITIGHKRLSLDGADLPKSHLNFILTEDGRLEEGFIRTFDREPLRR